MSLSFLSRLNACNSSFVKLQSVSEADCRVEAILLLLSSLVSCSIGWTHQSRLVMKRRARFDGSVHSVSLVLELPYPCLN